MSRLSEIIGSNEQFKEGAKKAIVQGFGGDEAIDKDDIDRLPLKWICPRYSNKYINDPKTTRALAKSIENIGLIQPIAVIEINKYLDNETIEEEERNYLLKMRDEYGCRYFISSGHRRYKAALSNALKKDVETNEDIIKFYKGLKTKDLYDNANNPFLSDDEKKEKKKLFIPCKIVKRLEDSEEKIYNDTNLTARATSMFELLANTLDSMGKEDPSIAEIKTYIYDNYGLEISESTLYNNLGLLNTFKADSRFLKAIFDGKLTNRDAKTLKTIFNKIDKDEVIKQIEDKTLNVDALKKSLMKDKGGRPKTRKYSKAEVLDMFHQVKLGNFTVDEMMKKISDEEI